MRASDAASPDEEHDRCLFDMGVPLSAGSRRDAGRQGSSGFWHMMRSFTAEGVTSDGQVNNTRIHDTGLHLWTSISLHDGHEGCITAPHTTSLIELCEITALQELMFDSAFQGAINPVKSITSESGRKQLCSIFIILSIATHVYCFIYSSWFGR